MIKIIILKKILIPPNQLILLQAKIKPSRLAMKQMKILQKLQLITKKMKTQNNLMITQYNLMIHKIVQTMKIKLKKLIIHQLLMRQIMIQ